MKDFKHIIVKKSMSVLSKSAAPTWQAIVVTYTIKIVLAGHHHSKYCILVN